VRIPDEIVSAFVGAIVKGVAAELRGTPDDALIDKHGAVELGELLDLVRRGELAGYRIGRRVAVRRSDLLAWIESRRIERPAAEPKATPDLDPIAEGLRAGRLRSIRGGRR
jgi:excisionase family DNA binding protein